MRAKKQKVSIQQTLGTVLSLLLCMYFAYHLLHGDRGFFANKGLQIKLVQAQEKLETKRQERIALENRVRLLRPDGIDLDLLDERARVVLGFVKTDERVILQTP